MENAVKTFEEACARLGIATTLPDVSGIPETFQKHVTAAYKRAVIANAIRGDWRPDWNDYDQPKWWPWFRFSGSAFVFGGSTYDYADTTTAVGSRLCFETKEQAEYFGREFIDLHNDFLMI
jgi:hypothetical protein